MLFIQFEFKNSIVLDLFSGSGSFGLECLSRDVSKVFFFEKNFMYSDVKGTPKEFNMFVKHISDAANEHKRFKTAFINEMKTKLEKFDKIDLSTLLRKYEM